MNSPLILKYDAFEPEIESDVFVAPNATVIGRVSLASQSSVYYGTVLRADINFISIGAKTNIQDNCTFHVSNSFGVTVGEGCTVGHNAVLHACTVGANTTIGMSSTIMDGSVIGEDSIVAAGSVVTPHKKFPPRSLILGSPAKKVRELTADEVEANKKMALKYLRVTSGQIEALSERDKSGL